MPLSWVGLSACIPGWWLGRIVGNGVGWSEFSLAGAFTQIAMSILIGLVSVLAINFALRVRTPGNVPADAPTGPSAAEGASPAGKKTRKRKGE
jgi:hypothetical protein